MTKVIKANGMLTLNDDTYEYIVKDGNNETNISEILKDSSNDKSKVVYINISINGRTALQEEGYLDLVLDNKNILSFMIAGENIDSFLFYRTGEYMDIEIKIHYRACGDR